MELQYAAVYSYMYVRRLREVQKASHRRNLFENSITILIVKHGWCERLTYTINNNNSVVRNTAANILLVLLYCCCVQVECVCCRLSWYQVCIPSYYLIPYVLYNLLQHRTLQQHSASDILQSIQMTCMYVCMCVLAPNIARVYIYTIYILYLSVVGCCVYDPPLDVSGAVAHNFHLLTCYYMNVFTNV